MAALTLGGLASDSRIEYPLPSREAATVWGITDAVPYLLYGLGARVRRFLTP
jgi:hypothetical protein